MHYDLISYFSYLTPLHCNLPFLSSKMGCRDCYISPAQAACWGQAPRAVGIGWCMSVLSPEVTFHKQQRIDYYCNLNNFVSPKLELCRKALVDISIELYFLYNDLISVFSIFGIQIGIFTDMIFKFITSEATSKFWKHHISFFIISIKFVSHQVLIHVWGFLMLLLLGLISVASPGRLSHSHSRYPHSL